MTLGECTREFVDHCRLHEPCYDAVMAAFSPERKDERWPEQLKHYCPAGAEALALACKRM